jgi:SulP family sulfate permease
MPSLPLTLKFTKLSPLVPRPHRFAAQTTDYFQHSLRFDLVAGLTVAMVAIPQSMAYAAIAGVNPIYGLYAAIVPAIVAALCGSSNHLVTGPTNATALVTAGALIAVSGGAGIELVFALAILSGLFRLILGVLKLGSIIRYVSNSVLTGFLAGAGVLIIINQLGNLLGLPRPGGAGTLTIVWELLWGLPQLNPYVLVTGLLAVSVLLGGKWIRRKIPAALLAIGLAGALVVITGWHDQGVKLISDLGTLQNVGLAFHMPKVNLSDLQMLLASAGAIALLSLVESMSVAKAIGLSSGQRINSSREFVAQGLASIAGGLFQAIPSSGSPSRSAVNFGSGAQSRLAGAFSGVLVLLAVLAFSRLIGFIPVASLAGVVIVSAYSMIDRHHLKLTWQSRGVSRLVLVVTFIATLLLPLHLAIYLGAVLSIGIYLYESSHLRLSYLTLSGNKDFVEHNLEEVLRECPPIALIDVEGALYFGAVEDLERHVEEILQKGVKVIILRVRHMHLLASTGVTALEGLVTRAEQLGTTVLLCGVTAEIETTLASSGIKSLVGSKRTFKATDTLFESTHQALQLAKHIVG